jgi:hypothetical protein
VPPADDSGRGYLSFTHELQIYQTATGGIDLSVGSHALVPVLDLYNHHPRPNVQFTYDHVRRAFVVSALPLTKEEEDAPDWSPPQFIAAGSEILDTYGHHTDSHLFAKYGFVNGDGSGHTQGALNLFHQIHLNIPNTRREQLKIFNQQQEQLLNYLTFDYGYDECIQPPKMDGTDTPDALAAWKLKRVKHKFMTMSIANNMASWVVIRTPNNPENLPPLDGSVTSDDLEASGLKTENIRFVLDGLLGTLATCRLLSAVHTDYNGFVYDMLAKNLKESGYVLPPAGPSLANIHDESYDPNAPPNPLELRAHMCLANMANTAMKVKTSPV